MKWMFRCALAAMALWLADGAQAQTARPERYPARPVRVIVPFAPGGVADVMGRLLAQKLSERLGEQFYVENHGGAGGNIGTGIAAGTAPDGHTILITSSSFVVNPSLHAKVPYDPVKDFAAVTIAAASPNVLVVHPSVAARTVTELVEVVRAERTDDATLATALAVGWAASANDSW